jgi:hypothetical protein
VGHLHLESGESAFVIDPESKLIRVDETLKYLMPKKTRVDYHRESSVQTQNAKSHETRFIDFDRPSLFCHIQPPLDSRLSTQDSGLSRFTPRMLLLIGPKFYNIILFTLLRKRVVSFDPLFQDFLLDVSSLIYSDAGVLVETKLVYQTSLASPESEIA